MSATLTAVLPVRYPPGDSAIWIFIPGTPITIAFTFAD
ncbi:hypothetical protein BDD21_2257 [Thiocapsa rosea]|uniref:Uncharacterized protein n=1 Tax=Thiocapsa rosea TaxID=69360 RepID=A0A495V8B6_9GAMM|nr:hypothetical protein BDD21_2257 [Thiocapsa rosea]